MNHEVYMWISALQNFSPDGSFISFYDLFDEITSEIRVHFKPHDFALVSLALPLLVRFAAVSMLRR